MEKLELDDILDIFRLGRSIEQEIPRTNWRFKTHGIGVSVHRSPDQTGGIDFDFDKPAPDAWRLSEFARRQADEGKLARDVYERVFADLDRLDTLQAQAGPRGQ